MTKEDLKEMRGHIEQAIVVKAGERRDPQLLDYMLEEAATEICVKGHVKSLPAFRVILNRFWDTDNPARFGLAELKQLTQRCGAEAGRYVALPFYSHRYPSPAGMTTEESNRANRLHMEAWHEKYDEMRRMIMEFGSPEQCEAFNEKEKAVLTPKRGIPPILDGCERHVFSPSQWKEYLAIYDAVLQTTAM